MKTYKPWEIVKTISDYNFKDGTELTADNKIKFVIDESGILRYTDDDNKATNEMPSSYLQSDHYFIIKEKLRPVTIEAAAKAFKNGKNIKCKYHDFTNSSHIITEIFKYDGLANSMPINSPEVTFYMINEGKWFIEDGGSDE